MTLRASIAAAVLLALVLVATAGAATIRGTARGELLRGTTRADRIEAHGGNDRVNAISGGRDTIACGAGRDVVTADGNDRVARDCETVSRRIAIDTLTGAQTGQHRTQVESHAAANGSTIVSVFQNGRFLDGGAGAIGFSTSRDGGRTWRSGLLRGLTRASPSPGEARRATDPVVAYDAEHRVWLANTLIFGESFSALFVSRSTNGVAWNTPIVAAEERNGLMHDKNWITCDNGSTSPFRGTCYIAYTDVLEGRIGLLTSGDGGITWSSPVIVSGRRVGDAVGALPLTQPDGELTVVYIEAGDASFGNSNVVAATSVDGGATFAPPERIAPLVFHFPRGLRAPPLPTATVDAAGRLYVAWTDCSFRSRCNGNDLALSTSTDGRTWSPRTRLPRTGFDSFVPALAAHPTQPGRLAVLTYLRTASACTRSCVGVAVLRSANGGATWTAPQRLDAEPMSRSWLAFANLGGAFLGDYVGLAYTEGAVVPTFPLATAPVGHGLDEAVFASVLPG